MNTPVETPLTEAPPKSRWKLWLIGFLLLGVGGYAVYRFGTGKPAESQQGQFGRGGPGFGGPGGRGGGPGRGAQTVPVRVVNAARQDLDVYLRALGTVTPINTVTVRARLNGELVRVNFTEGQRVSKGQVLAEIDARPYEVQLAQATGNLDEAKARLRNAETDLQRYQKLAQEQLITAQQVVSQESQVRQLQGTIQASEAQVANARLNLAYAKVVAPIDGRVGLRQVDPGNLVSSGDQNGIVVITQIRPISVIFTIPETDLPAVLASFKGNRKLAVEAWDRADAIKLATGVLQTVDNQIDTATGTIKLRATFDNGDESLFPNQFVNIRLKVRTVSNATVIPAAAVQRAAFGEFVYVVKQGQAPDDKSVTIQRVTLGPTEGDRVAVTSGVAPQAQVVLEGVDQLTEGAKVEIVPEGGAAPQPPAGRRRGGAGPGGQGGTGGQGGAGGQRGPGGGAQGAPGAGQRGPGGDGQRGPGGDGQRRPGGNGQGGGERRPGGPQ
jgi:multidrug efflux system membrane fusion protein